MQNNIVHKPVLSYFVFLIVLLNGVYKGKRKGKGEILPRTGHEDPDGE
jgi:hypothetical protein